MRVLVLGSAAGGGFPQWNCNCRNCRGVREGSLRASPRTQSSIAVSAEADPTAWVIINASPDILAQLRGLPELQPGRRPRDSGISAVILVNSQLDHTLGLAMLREGDRLQVYCTASVRADLTTASPLLRVLENYCGVDWHEIELTPCTFQLPALPRLEFTAIAVAGKAPPYSPYRQASSQGDNIALRVSDRLTGRSLFYAPSLAAVDTALLEWMKSADCLLVDGTFWSDDEMIRSGVGLKRARDMGHLPLSGERGLLSYLRALPKVRKILTHINNTNPILDEDSAERRELEQAGIEVAHDRMEIRL